MVEEDIETKVIPYAVHEKIVLKQDTNVIMRVKKGRRHLDIDVILNTGTKITFTHSVKVSKVYGFTIDIIKPYIVPATENTIVWHVKKELLDELQPKVPFQ